MCFCHFTYVNSFCDFLFASLDIETLPSGVYSYSKKFLQEELNLSSRVGSYLQEKRRLKMAELSLLKVYPFTL